MTTAHYYTPSGRLIQRPWDETFDEYLSYTQRDQDANKPHNPSDLKRTDAGRPVYSGGGIEPDKYLAGPTGAERASASATPFGRMLYARQEFENFAQKFNADGDTRITQASTGRVTVAPNFVVDDAMMADFREQLKTQHDQDRRGGVRQGPRVHQGDDPLPDRRGAVRHRPRRCAASCRSIRRRKLGCSMFGEAEKLAGTRRRRSTRAN